LVRVKPNYVGFTIPDEFVVGYGLDYLELYRNLTYIATLTDKAKKRLKE
jgi:hypoxanthine phosphoribosyltransferase